jgi:hypothetical protein
MTRAGRAREAFATVYPNHVFYDPCVVVAPSSIPKAYERLLEVSGPPIVSGRFVA